MSIYPYWAAGSARPQQSQQDDPPLIGRLVTVSADVPPVATPDELAADLKVTTPDEGPILEELIDTAQAWCEAWTGRSFTERDLALYLDFAPPAGIIEITGGPVSEVTAFTYFDADGVETAVDSSSYLVDLVSMPARVVLKSGSNWPTGLRQVNALKVAFTGGYADGAVPKALKRAVRNMAAEGYLTRGKQVDADDLKRAAMPTSDTLLALEPFKVIR